MKSNDPAQAGRGNGVRLLTDAQSRPCLQPDSSSCGSSEALLTPTPLLPGGEGINLSVGVPGAALVPRLPRAIVFRPSGALGFGSLRSHIDERKNSAVAGHRATNANSTRHPPSVEVASLAAPLFVMKVFNVQ
jgi:hypothetical protein